jgi:hypothetical protein
MKSAVAAMKNEDLATGSDLETKVVAAGCNMF